MSNTITGGQPVSGAYKLRTKAGPQFETRCNGNMPTAVVARYTTRRFLGTFSENAQAGTAAGVTDSLTVQLKIPTSESTRQADQSSRAFAKSPDSADGSNIPAERLLAGTLAKKW